MYIYMNDCAPVFDVDQNHILWRVYVVITLCYHCSLNKRPVRTMLWIEHKRVFVDAGRWQICWGFWLCLKSWIAFKQAKICSSVRMKQWLCHEVKLQIDCKLCKTRCLLHVWLLGHGNFWNNCGLHPGSQHFSKKSRRTIFLKRIGRSYYFQKN